MWGWLATSVTWTAATGGAATSGRECATASMGSWEPTVGRPSQHSLWNEVGNHIVYIGFRERQLRAYWCLIILDPVNIYIDIYIT